MVIITSPSKSMNTEAGQDIPVSPTQPRFLDVTQLIHEQLKGKSIEELEDILGVSEKLAKLNYDRYQAWELSHSVDNSCPALLFYDGDVFQEMDPDTYSKEDWEYAQKTVRILSGYYGLVRPLDLLQPYRLEMNTKIPVGKADDLYALWEKHITQCLNTKMTDDEDGFLVNLASNQYSKVINRDKFEHQWVDVDFKEERDDGLKTIAIYAKKARGMMMDYCIKNNINTLEAIKSFDDAGYTFQSEEAGTILFTRKS